MSYVPRVDYAPTFSNRQDINVGVSKAFRFDRDFRRVDASGNSSAATVWSFGSTALYQRRFMDPSPSSNALIFLPSASYVISAQWNATFGIDLTQRWFDPVSGTAQREFTLLPVLSDALFGSGERAVLFCSPAIDLVAGVQRSWSNVSSGTFMQVVAGAAIEAGWRL